MIRSILLPLAEKSIPSNTLNYAFWLAKKEGSCIKALAVVDVAAFEIPVLGTPDGFMPSVVSPPVQESQALFDEMTALAEERLDRFAKQCASGNIPCTTETKFGIPGEVIARTAVAHDIVVMSRSGYSRIPNTQEKLDPLVSQVIRESIRPVLVAGSELPAEGDINNILVAYDGSLHAGRALLVAAELGARPGVQCTVVVVAPSEELGEQTLSPAEAFLYHHGVTPKKRVVVGVKPSDVICDLVTSVETDILVMGAYGHSPIREVLFGSTTERVLSQCTATVILQS